MSHKVPIPKDSPDPTSQLGRAPKVISTAGKTALGLIILSFVLAAGGFAIDL